MYTLINVMADKIIATPKNDAELVDLVSKIVRENEDFDVSILGRSDAFEYINDFCDDLTLLDDSEVDAFLDKYGVEVLENEPCNYVEMMMDNHKCTQWKDKQYYISDSLSLTDDEQEMYDALVYSLHVQ